MGVSQSDSDADDGPDEEGHWIRVGMAKNIEEYLRTMNDESW